MFEIQAIGVDETSSRHGHDHIALFVDFRKKRLLFTTPSKDAQTFARFARDPQAHSDSAEAITEVRLDLSPAFQKGAAEHLPNDQFTFERFHLVKLVNEAVDAVRKGEAQSQPSFKKTRWLWLKNPSKLTAKQSKKIRGSNQRANHADSSGLSVPPYFSRNLRKPA
ncbi:transposase (plasmid) [Acidithiobacillus caldus ATCC 51756]|uniref:Transposase n=1 Tax=Acidithiobacillus caldus (strain ATCC 51756 / DSM 8584 / KU) TaxID=637389 RepID=A0A059ZVR7_ACICK|nr:transposase [Acidithiobacillus caldus ATCC 51756]